MYAARSSDCWLPCTTSTSERSCCMHVASSSDESICGMLSGRLKLGITTLTPMPSPVLTFIGGCGFIIGRREEEALMANAVCQREAACFGARCRSPTRRADGQNFAPFARHPGAPTQPQARRGSRNYLDTLF
jgi:hypothetical protein